MAADTKDDKWRKQPPPSPALLEKRRKLFAALSDFVSASGGWVVSLPGERLVRIEAPPNSPVSNKLTKLGYCVASLGSGTRVHDGIIAVDLWQIEIPG